MTMTATTTRKRTKLKPPVNAPTAEAPAAPVAEAIQSTEDFINDTPATAKPKPLADFDDHEDDEDAIPQSTADLIRTTPLASDNRPLALKEKGEPPSYLTQPPPRMPDARPPRGFGDSSPWGSYQPPPPPPPPPSASVVYGVVSRVDVWRQIEIEVVRSGPDKGLMRTIGMNRYGQLDLLVGPGTPLFVVDTVKKIMREVADLMLNGTSRVQDGTRVRSGEALFTMRVVNYQGRSHFQLSDDETPSNDWNNYGGYRSGYGGYGHRTGDSCGIGGGCNRKSSDKFDL